MYIKHTFRRVCKYSQLYSYRVTHGNLTFSIIVTQLSTLPKWMSDFRESPCIIFVAEANVLCTKYGCSSGLPKLGWYDTYGSRGVLPIFQTKDQSWRSVGSHLHFTEQLYLQVGIWDQSPKFPEGCDERRVGARKMFSLNTNLVEQNLCGNISVSQFRGYISSLYVPVTNLSIIRENNV